MFRGQCRREASQRLKTSVDGQALDRTMLKGVTGGKG